MTTFQKITILFMAVVLMFICLPNSMFAVTSNNTVNKSVMNLAATSSDVSQLDNDYLIRLAKTQQIINTKDEKYRKTYKFTALLLDLTSSPIDTIVKKLKEEAESLLYGTGDQFVEQALLKAVEYGDANLEKLRNATDDQSKAAAMHDIMSKYATGMQNLLDNAVTEEQENAIIKYSAGVTAKYLAAQSEQINTLINLTLPEVNSRLNSMEDNFEEKYTSLISNFSEQNKIISNLESSFEELNEKYGVFSNRVTQEIANNTAAINEIGNIVNDLGKVVVQHDQILTEFGEILDFHGEIIGYHEQRLDELEGVVVDLGKEMGLIADDVSFNQSLIFGILPTKEKLRALSNPRFLAAAFPDTEERNKAVENLRMQTLKETIANDINQYTSYLKTAAIIAGELGIGSEKDQKKINQVVEYASVAANLCASFASGNYVGMAVTVASLFSKKKGNDSTSPEQQRFDAIMGMLRHIDAKLDIIEKKVDHVIELQVATLEAIASLEDTINNHAKSIKEELRYIEWDQQAIKALVISTSYLYGQLTKCKTFLDSRNIVVGEESYPAFIDFTVGNFYSFADLAAHYGSNVRNCQLCMEDGLKSLFSPNSLNALLLMESYSTPDGKEGLQKEFIDPVFNTILSLFKNNYGDGVNAFYGLGNPSYNYDDLTKKIYNDITSLNVSYNQMPNISKLIHPTQIQYYVYMLLEMLLYEDIVNKSDLSLKTSQVLLAQENYNPNNILRDLINPALKLTYLAIAQQTLLNGDAVIPLIHKRLFSKRLSQEAIHNTIKALAHNPYLAHNYLVSQLSMEMNYAGRVTGDVESYENRLEKNLEIYQAIFDGTEPCSSFSRIFTTNWNSDLEFIKISIECDAAGSYIVLNNKLEGDNNITTKLRLPDPSSIKNKTYAYREELEQLITLRDKLLSYAISNYESVTMDDLYHLFGNQIDNTFSPIALINDHYMLQAGEELNIPVKYYDIEGDDVQISIDSSTSTLNNQAVIENNILTYLTNSSYIGEDILTLKLDDGSNVTQTNVQFTIVQASASYTQADLDAARQQGYQEGLSKCNGCVEIKQDLTLQIPCAYYGTTFVEFMLNSSANPTMPLGYNWVLNLSSLKTIQSTVQAKDNYSQADLDTARQQGYQEGLVACKSCVEIKPDLTLRIPCAYYGTTYVEFILNPFANPDMPFVYNWVLDLNSVKPKN
ncbi:MAG: hypothetical protein HQK77_16285 [Desulfobacterales bacterium]|nr:hypothetical protein [Desulfobacterales bacterium]